MNININDVRSGMTLIVDGNLSLILEFQHVKPGKGAAFVKLKLKNLKTGSIIESTFNTSTKLVRAHVEKIPAQYLYSDGSTYHFMNTENYEQLEIDETKLVDEIKYLKEQLEIELTIYEGEIIGISLPEKISYEVTFAEPGVRGNTVSGAMKDATLETGLQIKVPLFINQGDHVVISTKDGKYQSKA